MDIIKFTSSGPVSGGQVVEGFSSKMWIERYRDPGEFKLIAPISSGIREKLPMGTFITHMDTVELMIVENHEINDVKGQESEIVITGRSWETFLENRIIGSNKYFPLSETPVEYPLISGYTWIQARTLIENHCLQSYLADANNAIPYFEVRNVVSTGTSLAADRSVKRGPLHKALLDFLAIDNLGIKAVRPGPWSNATNGVNFVLTIYKGVDRTAGIIFSWDRGEIETADYFWTNRTSKNSALIVGKWVQTVVVASSGYSRRTMLIDASDIDQGYASPPGGADLTAVVTAMQQRGRDILAANNSVTITKAEVTKEGTRYKYRTDYNLGDIVTVSGDYNSSAAMMVVEYVETEDSTGVGGYPTLSL